MSNLFWHLGLTLALTTVKMTSFTTEVLMEELGTWEREAIVVSAGTLVPVSSSREMVMQLLLRPFSDLTLVQPQPKHESWAMATLETH